MSIPACFSFENSKVRTLGTPDLPLFVAIDVASALGFQKPSNAVFQHVDTEDLIKQEITDKLGRAQTVNCVNESGLYALIFGSKLESAKRFKLLHDILKYPPNDINFDPPRGGVVRYFYNDEKVEDHGFRCSSQRRFQNHDYQRMPSSCAATCS